MRASRNGKPVVVLARRGQTAFYDYAPPRARLALPRFCEVYEIALDAPPGEVRARILDELSRLPRVTSRREALEYRVDD